MDACGSQVVGYKKTDLRGGLLCVMALVLRSAGVVANPIGAVQKYAAQQVSSYVQRKAIQAAGKVTGIVARAAGRAMVKGTKRAYGYATSGRSVKRRATGMVPMRKAGFVRGHPVVALPRGGSAQEKKYKDINLATGEVTAIQIHPVFASAAAGIAVGTGPSQRIGRKAFVSSIQGNMVFAMKTNLSHPDGVVGLNRLRIMLVEDTQCNGSIMTVASLLESAADEHAAYHSYLNMAQIGRFKVLKDKKITVGRHRNVTADGATANVFDYNAGEFTEFKFYKKLYGKSIEYDQNVGTSGTLDELTRSNYY